MHLGSRFGVIGANHLHPDEECDRDRQAKEQDIGFRIIVHLMDGIGKKLSELEDF